MLLGKAAASIVVSELVAQHGLDKPEGRRTLSRAGRIAVDKTAGRIVELVDQVLGKSAAVTAICLMIPRTTHEAATDLLVRLRRASQTFSLRRSREMVALPLISSRRWCEAGRKPMKTWRERGPERSHRSNNFVPLEG